LLMPRAAASAISSAASRLMEPAVMPWHRSSSSAAKASVTELFRGQAREVPIFMFVNSKSGGQRGAKLLEVPQPFHMPLGDTATASLRIFDILDGPSGNKPGFVQLKEATKTESIVRMIVAGGDGSILWAIEEAEKHGIDTRSQILLAVIPLGTGNDFARFTGWGGKAPNMSSLTKGTCQGLRDLVYEWTIAKPRLHDVWKVAIQVDEGNGAILQTGKERKKVPIGDKSIERLMHSYFSAGNDARAGMGQEKARTATRWGNLPFREKEYVKDFARSLHHGGDGESAVVFTTDVQHCPGGPQLVGNPQVLLMLNIPNCYGGLCRFWDGAGSLGIDSASSADLLKADLDPSDGNLEVLTYNSVLMEPVIDIATKKLPAHRFNAKRVFSGAPLFLKFHEEVDEHVIVHCQIDGEFFKLQNPKSVRFELHRKIRVLHGGHVWSADEMASYAEDGGRVESTSSSSPSAGDSSSEDMPSPRR